MTAEEEEDPLMKSLPINSHRERAKTSELNIKIILHQKVNTSVQQQIQHMLFSKSNCQLISTELMGRYTLKRAIHRGDLTSATR